MKSQIIQYILSLFSDETTGKMAEQVGENHSSVKNALESIIPAILHGFSSKSGEGPTQVNKLLELASNANSSSWFQTASSWFTGSDLITKGEEMLNTIFGNKNVDRIAANVAAKNNIKVSSASKLMQWAAPLCVGAIGKFAAEGKINTGSIISLFGNEKLDLDGITPSKTTDSAIPSVSTATAATIKQSYTEEKSSSSKMWLPIILLLLIAGLIFWFLKGCNNTSGGSATTDTTAVSAPVVNAAPVTISAATPTFKLNADSTLIYSYGDTITENLPDGTALRMPNNSAEALLITNIKTALEKGLDTTEAGKKAGWINLYDVQFSKMLTYREGATAQIGKVAQILKAYPSVHIKLGGYTDNTGAAAANQKLSQERAELVAKDLVAAGVGGQVEKAEGYGIEFPAADNATSEGRAQNRRVSCRIVSITK